MNSRELRHSCRRSGRNKSIVREDRDRGLSISNVRYAQPRMYTDGHSEIDTCTTMSPWINKGLRHLRWDTLDSQNATLSLRGSLTISSRNDLLRWYKPNSMLDDVDRRESGLCSRRGRWKTVMPCDRWRCSIRVQYVQVEVSSIGQQANDQESSRVVDARRWGRSLFGMYGINVC